MLKQFIPPILFRPIKKLKPKKYGWFGNYSSWEEAKIKSEGYEKEVIVEKVRFSLLKVVSKEAVFERDSVLFFEEEFNYPLLSALFYAQTKSQQSFNVIDFGGSLGSSYFQNHKFLNHIEGFSWNIIEQKHFVEIGKQDFENEELKFFYTIEDCLEKKNVECLLLSSVLQYLEKPYDFLKGIFEYNFKTIIIDRMPFNVKSENRITIQKVHPEIYNASYPCHLLNRDEFVRLFEENSYKLHSHFEAIDGKGDDYSYKGYIFEKG